MQFVWQHRLGLRGGQTTVDGRRVSVVDQGILNADAGPDFFNATVEIDGQTWVGNVESMCALPTGSAIAMMPIPPTIR